MQSRESERNRLGMLFGFLAMVIVVASVIGTLAATGRFNMRAGLGSKPETFGAVLRIDTIHSAHLYCPSSPSFSPDGTQFAVLGTGVPCTDPAAVLPRENQHKLAIYEVGTGLLHKVIDLDRFFQLDTIEGCADVPVRALQFTGLGWSPDGEHIGVLYAAFDYAAFDVSSALSPNDVVCSGLLLLSKDSGTAVTIGGDSGFFDAATNTYAGYAIWNLFQLSASTPSAVAPSLVYGWSQGGYPQSVSPLTGQQLDQLPISAGPGYPVGNPSGDSTYTLWQPGIVAGPEVFSGGTGTVADDDVFVTQFPSWTPSGQYVTMLVAGVQLAPVDSQDQTGIAPTPTNPTAAPLVTLPPDLTQVPARDAALVAVQQQIGQDGWAMTAWNDGGTALASINCASDTPARIELRETETGALVRSMPLGLSGNDAGCSIFNFSQALGDYPNPNLSMEWSPDGAHLLLCDQTANMVTLLRVTSV